MAEKKTSNKHRAASRSATTELPVSEYVPIHLVKQKVFNYENVLRVLQLNQMEGMIEVGYRYWISQTLNEDWCNRNLYYVAKRMRELWEFTTLSTIPCEDSFYKLQNRIRSLALHYVEVDAQQNKLGNIFNPGK